MAAKKSLLKIFIIFILAVFLLSTALVSVLYLGGNAPTSQGTGDDLSSEIIISTGDILSGTSATGTN